MSQFIPLQPGGIYHIFNHAVGAEKLFCIEENYFFFLEKIEQHLLGLMDLFTYSLIPNHFHLMVRIKTEEEIVKLFKKEKKREFKIETDIHSGFVMERVSNCLNAYTKSYNKFYGRMGSLFMPTKRSVANVDGDVTNFVLYVHKNAVHHHLTKKIGDWKFDGYNSIISGAPTFLLRSELFDWFGSREAFIRAHENLQG